LNDMQHWQFLGTHRVQVMKNWTMSMNAYKTLWTDLQAEGYLYLPVGHINQDFEENLFSGMRGNLGHNGNPSAAEIPSCFERSFVKNLAAVSKGKNCRDDEAVNLLSMEELIEAVKDQQSLEDQMDLGNLGLVLDPEQEEEPQDLNNNDTESRLERTASAKLAAPHIEKFIANLKCDSCKTELQSEAQFPLHLDHTMTSGPSDALKLLPSELVAEAVRAIAHTVKLAQGSFHLQHITQRILNFVMTIPEVQSLRLCLVHEEHKPKLIMSLVKQAVQDRLKEINRKRKEDKAIARAERAKTCTKYKRITHQ